jgi:tetratricopeptide (TPR) repeat protein
MEFPLYADFSTELLGLTENTKIAGQISIEYDFLGKRVVSTESVIISVNNRNAFTWNDYASLAAFISPSSQEVAAFAKEVAGITRNNLYTGMNANLQYAAGIIEGLRLVSMSYAPDKTSAYPQYHNSYDLDSIQYPLQTLQYLSGDVDELALLVCSCLQIVNVPTGFMPLEDDVLVLVKLGIRPDQVLNHFASKDGLVIDEESQAVYLPLSMLALEKGFTECYKAGMKSVIKCFSSEENNYEFIDTTDAWTEYKPVAYSNGASVVSVKQEDLVKSLKTAIQNYIASDIEVVISRARSEGDTNRLGLALVKAGRYSEAKREFQKLSTPAAMNNVANILMIEKNYVAAAEQYRRVLSKDPENKAAQRGLENANAKIE